jgi:hypothetical protein
MKHWRDHVDDAQTLLNLAQARGAFPVKAQECLYEAMIAITRAINELEGKEAHGGL